MPPALYQAILVVRAYIGDSGMMAFTPEGRVPCARVDLDGAGVGFHLKAVISCY